MNKFFKVLSVSCLSLLMGMMMIMPASAEESIEPTPTITDVVYDENGEVESFFVPIPEGEQNLNTIMARSSSRGVYKYVDGVCFVIELLSGYSCAGVIREIGGGIVSGKYYWGGRPYTGTWQVTYGYKPGCQPQHSGVCFGATYTKIG